jgi:uncharacterized RmlC-like cupin family protein
VRRNTEIAEGFRPHLGYSRGPTTRLPPFRWRADPVGRGLLILIGLIGDEAVGQGLEVTRDFAERGAGARSIYAKLLTIAPWAADYYAARRGCHLTPAIVFDRYHKMYYDNRKERVQRGQRSPEHYMASPALRPYIAAVEKLYRRSCPITALTLTEACAS